ncbi:phosphoadenosine phosphosulfate reductase [Campylobacterota bacterium]|nr:phosphoadenosine phosphosulfate reductase [Campylobacterota bacterium]
MQYSQYSDRLGKILSKIRGKIALSFSYQAEDVAALHILLLSGAKNYEIFTLDTRKTFKECAVLHKEVEKFFGVKIKRYYPNKSAIADLEIKLGEWGMRESLENRRLCCETRKVEPLKRALKNKTAWVTGLRAAQSVTRNELKIVEYDEKFDCVKVNPIAEWSEDDVFSYIKKHNLPTNALYSQGFKSIGCAPCTRAVKDGEDARSGRWWWENPEHKECGLHIKG